MYTTRISERDRRPQLGFWAPGFYTNRCFYCGVEFIGDKRAKSCADCAYAGKVPLIVRAARCISDVVKEVYAGHLIRWVKREAQRRKREEGVQGRL